MLSYSQYGNTPSSLNRVEGMIDRVESLVEGMIDNINMVLDEIDIVLNSLFNVRIEQRDEAEIHLKRLRKICTNWLIDKVIPLAVTDDVMEDGHDTENMNTQSGEELADRAARILANLSGRAASGPIVRTFEFTSNNSAQAKKVDKLLIREPSYCEADIGAMSWSSGVVMAEMIHSGEINLLHPGTEYQDILELGCGTGCAGIMTAILSKRLTSNRKVWMTDYHPAVLSNLKLNLELNNLVEDADVVIRQLDWRWFVRPHGINNDVDDANGDTLLNCQHLKNDILDTNEMANNDFDITAFPKFNTIIAADCIFSLTHSYLIPLVLQHLLTPTDRSRAHILIPLRLKYHKDVECFEEQLGKRGFKLRIKNFVKEGHEWSYRYYEIRWPHQE